MSAPTGRSWKQRASAKKVTAIFGVGDSPAEKLRRLVQQTLREYHREQDAASFRRAPTAGISEWRKRETDRCKERGPANEPFLRDLFRHAGVSRGRGDREGVGPGGRRAKAARRGDTARPCRYASLPLLLGRLGKAGAEGTIRTADGGHVNGWGGGEEGRGRPHHATPSALPDSRGRKRAASDAAAKVAEEEVKAKAKAAEAEACAVGRWLLVLAAAPRGCQAACVI